jgi:hypothetical protein
MALRIPEDPACFGSHLMVVHHSVMHLLSTMIHALHVLTVCSR